MIDIKNIQGNVLLSTPINEGSKRKFMLMKEDYIKLKFSLQDPMFFLVGSYVETDYGRFEVCGLQTPTYNSSNGGYDYELRLDAHYWKWKNKIFKYTPETSGQEASWNLTATLDVHLGVVLRNLKALGYKYGTADFSFSIDSSVENKPQLMSYQNISILDALFEMAKKWECECWVSDSIIHFGKLEYGTPIAFELGKNVNEMPRSESRNDYATRLYVFGSEKNLPENYRKSESNLVVNGVVQKRLMLPIGTPYIDAYPNMSTDEAIEQVVVLDNIFPKTECVVGSVGSYTSTITDEETKEKHTETFYYVSDTSGLVFKKEYILQGQELRIQFQSGKLNGLEFGVIFRTAGEKVDGTTLSTDVYELVASEDYGRKLPDNLLCPAAGDKFILIGWDSTKIGNTNLITTAETRLKEEGEKLMEKMKIDPSTYNCKMMSDTIYSADGLHHLYEAGQKVNLINKAYFENGRVSRIIGFEYNLDYPYDSPIYIVGETASYSRISDLEEKVEELTLNGQTFVGGNGSGVYLITSYDQTPATEKNTFSAKRLVRELSKLLRKDAPDSTEYLLKFLGGAEIGQAIDSFINGKGTILDQNGRIQTDRLEVRQSMKVLELIINRLQGIENDFVFSPTRKVLKVEPIDATTYKLHLDPFRDGDLLPFRDGNICYSIVNDFLIGGSNYYTSYFRVLTTNQNDYSITVSLYSDSEVPGGKNHIPAAGYNISRRGHANLLSNKEDAQSWYISSSEGRLLFLQNVVKPMLEDYNYAISIGRFPQIQAVKDIGIGADEVGVMAQTIIAQHIYYYDYNGDVVPSVVDRGMWDLAIAGSAEKPYRNITVETMRPSGTKYTLLEQHAVWRWGCKWGCLKDKTTEEPRWNAKDWVLLEGDSKCTMDFESTEGLQFLRNNVNTTIIMSVYHADEDITERLLSTVGTEVEWLRDSGNIPSDNGWKPTFDNNKRNRLIVTNKDMPTGWGNTVRKLKFVCRVFIPSGGAVPLAQNDFGFKI